MLVFEETTQMSRASVLKFAQAVHAFQKLNPASGLFKSQQELKKYTTISLLILNQRSMTSWQSKTWMKK